jgi:hypothetical protein
MQARFVAAVLPVLLASAPGVAAAEAILVPPQLERLPESEVDARLRMLEERLEAGRFTGQLWQQGWTGFYALTTLTGTVGAVAADDADGRVVNLVSAVKSVGALAQLVTDPLPARLGAAPMGEADPDRRLMRLALGERQLATNAARASSRFSLQRHLEGVTTNLIGGAVIWAFGDSGDALTSTLVGIAIGEAQIWSQPWRAEGDLAAYRTAFPTTTVQRAPSWELRPMGTGVQLALRF